MKLKIWGSGMAKSRNLKVMLFGFISLFSLWMGILLLVTIYSRRWEGETDISHAYHMSSTKEKEDRVIPHASVQ